MLCGACPITSIKDNPDEYDLPFTYGSDYMSQHEAYQEARNKWLREVNGVYDVRQEVQEIRMTYTQQQPPMFDDDNEEQDMLGGGGEEDEEDELEAGDDEGAAL